MDELQVGTVVHLQVARKAPFGFFLTNGKKDVLLHESEVQDEPEPGDTVEVFLYQDKEGRLAATMTIPDVRIGNYGWSEVVTVNPGGVFIHIGISKDILIHKSDLPKLQEVWPRPGGQLYCTLKTDRNGRLLGLPANEKVMERLFRKAGRDALNKNVTGVVYRTLRSGTFILTEEGYRGFIHQSQREKEPCLGDIVNGRIIDVKEDGTVNVSLLKRNYEKLDEDARKILEYLVKRGGKMPYSDHSAPEEIKKCFAMSKGAFKRATGRLMKKGKVYQKNGWTYLTDPNRPWKEEEHEKRRV